MSNLTSVMLCKHKKSRKKLVSWAIDSRYGHEQGFRWVDCCTYCGRIIIENPDTKAGA